jgi:hypothetical protein
MGYEMDKPKLRDHIDASRLIRAVKVQVYRVGADNEPLPEHHFMARSSKDGVYYLHTEPHLYCDCPDYTMRDAICKHILKALMVEGDPSVLMAMQKTGVLHYMQQGNKNG